MHRVLLDTTLRNFIVLPFNVDHAMRCGILTRQWPRNAGDDLAWVQDKAPPGTRATRHSAMRTTATPCSNTGFRPWKEIS